MGVIKGTFETAGDNKCSDVSARPCDCSHPFEQDAFDPPPFSTDDDFVSKGMPDLRGVSSSGISFFKYYPNSFA